MRLKEIPQIYENYNCIQFLDNLCQSKILKKAVDLSIIVKDTVSDLFIGKYKIGIISSTDNLIDTILLCINEYHQNERSYLKRKKLQKIIYKELNTNNHLEEIAIKLNISIVEIKLNGRKGEIINIYDNERMNKFIIICKINQDRWKSIGLYKNNNQIYTIFNKKMNFKKIFDENNKYFINLLDHIFI
jgi:hypothetical protein